MTKKIIVTGGCGFIGSNLVRKLTSHENWKIFIVDNFKDGRKYLNISKFRGIELIHFHDFFNNLPSIFEKYHLMLLFI